ncbi:hypothetical protein PPK15_gp10 [Bacillus phage 000TH010]|uniref:Uncharacterized protein n=1 Tax=Bacillus phage 000TH010 TaxID=2601652 RepID=A0A5P8PHP5_9CAUD|nr:hypothetical protein PPK15_gp10 [Bacillus phage 000TH010]QFR56223.1 hypothetical protein 000TH010_10 [Bacillus phage 000TH010]
MRRFFNNSRKLAIKNAFKNTLRKNDREKDTLNPWCIRVCDVQAITEKDTKSDTETTQKRHRTI